MARRLTLAADAALAILLCIAAASCGTDRPTPIRAASIYTQPMDQSVLTGDSATFAVVADGTSPFKYQWRCDGVNVTGATAASYTTPATVLADSGSRWDVVVDNDAGMPVTSHAATLTVTRPRIAPAITTEPQSQAVLDGQSATFAVVATGTAPLSFQWRKGGVAIDGATGASYVTPAVAMIDSGSRYDVVVDNVTGHPASSASATLTVNPAPVQITAQPADQSVTAPVAATFSVTAIGTAPLTYQWRRGGVVIAGANGSTYTTGTTSLAESLTTFDVVINNGANVPATSRPATLIVAPTPVAPSITTQPQDRIVRIGSTATFTVAASGSAPLHYQWQRNGADIANATLSTYTTPATTASDEGAVFSCTVWNVVTSVGSAPATLSLKTWPFGDMAALVVGSGEIVTLQPGRVYDYASVTVQDGGTLMVGAGGGAAEAWTFIGSLGPITVTGSGQILAVLGQDATPATFMAQAPAADGTPTGETVSYQARIATGGGGGAGGYGCSNDGGGCALVGTPGAGGAAAASVGHGAGGGGASNWGGCSAGRGSSPTAAAGGVGGDGCYGNYAGGAGAVQFGQAGTAGTDAPSGSGNGGGGGGGGFLGFHGFGLYLKSKSISGIVGTGTISVAGGAGGAGGFGGGNAENGSSLSYSGGGGGGGGGAGGSGGQIIVRLPSGAPSPAARLLYGGGAGGSGTSPWCNQSNYGSCGAKGGDGASGSAPDVRFY